MAGAFFMPGTTGQEIVMSPAANSARDPRIAEREEFEAAVSAQTGEALLHFLERHPNGSFAAEARERLKKLQNGLSR